ncbi:MAG: nucleotide sugar dehydrogenase [Bacteroidota bacterium]
MEKYLNKTLAISVTGLGYVGLPLALELARHFRVIGFDLKPERIALMKQAIDPSEELGHAAFEGTDIKFTSEAGEIAEASFHIVAVPTPVTAAKVPDLAPLLSATKAVGQILQKGDTVVFESTVYPGCTEEDCVPVLESESGLKFGVDFGVGYSPERINPGDTKHTLTKILKVVSANDAPTLDLVSGIYGHIIEAGIHKASSIRVAEAAKVIENAQRDINIGFVNELSLIFHEMGIDTSEVLEAAGTKWNFLSFRPGLVGGHCIGVDPYYLVYKAQQLGYTPEVITSGRRINDGMPGFVAKEVAQSLTKQGHNLRETRLLLMGITFKENVADIRNSKVVDLVYELEQFGISIDVIDPVANAEHVSSKYNFELCTEPTGPYHAIVVAVAHQSYEELDLDYFRDLTAVDQPLLLFDLKGIYNRANAQSDELIWRL